MAESNDIESQAREREARMEAFREQAMSGKGVDGIPAIRRHIEDIDSQLGYLAIPGTTDIIHDSTIIIDGKPAAVKNPVYSAESIIQATALTMEQYLLRLLTGQKTGQSIGLTETCRLTHSINNSAHMVALRERMQNENLTCDFHTIVGYCESAEYKLRASPETNIPELLSHTIANNRSGAVSGPENVSIGSLVVNEATKARALRRQKIVHFIKSTDHPSPELRAEYRSAVNAELDYMQERLLNPETRDVELAGMVYLGSVITHHRGKGIITEDGDIIKAIGQTRMLLRADNLKPTYDLDRSIALALATEKDSGLQHIRGLDLQINDPHVLGTEIQTDVPRRVSARERFEEIRDRLFGGRKNNDTPDEGNKRDSTRPNRGGGGSFRQ